MAGQKPFPLYTDGTLVYYTTDGVTFTSVGGGGTSTIHTSAPLSGDGSVGTPATIAAGAVALTKLATQADQTVLLNVSGGAASPIAGSKAQLLTLLGLGTDWYSQEAAFHATQIPQLTESLPIPLGPSNDFAITGVSVVDAGVPGGAFRGNSDSLWSLLNKATVIQSLNTTKFALSFQASLSPIASGKVSYLGLTNAGQTTEVTVATQQSIDGTNFVGFTYDGTAAINLSTNLGAADASVYTWRIFSDGTTLTMQRAAKAGGGAALSTGTIATATTHFPTASVYPALFNSAGTVGQAVYKCLVSYIGP